MQEEAFCNFFTDGSDELYEIFKQHVEIIVSNSKSYNESITGGTEATGVNEFFHNVDRELGAQKKEYDKDLQVLQEQETLIVKKRIENKELLNKRLTELEKDRELSERLAEELKGLENDQGRVKEVREKRADVEKKIKGELDHINQLKGSIAEMENEQSHVLLMIQIKEQQIQELVNRQEQFEMSFNNEKLAVQQLQQSVQNEKAQLYNTTEQQYNLLLIANEELQKNLQDIKLRKKQLERELNESLTRINKLIKQKEAEEVNLRNFEDILNNLIKERNLKMEEKQRLENATNQLDREIRELTIRKTQLAIDAAAVSEQENDENKQLLERMYVMEKENTNLLEKHNKMMEEKEQIQREIEQTGNKLAKLKKHADEMIGIYTERQKEFLNIKENVDVLETEKKTALEKSAALLEEKLQLEHENEEQIKTLTEQRENYKFLISSNENSLRSMEKELDKLTARKQTRLQEINSLIADITTDDSLQEQENNLEREINQLEEQIFTAQISKEQTIAKFDEEEKKIAAQIGERERQKQQLINVYKQLDKQNTRNRERVDELEGEQKQLLTQIDSIHAEISARRETMAITNREHEVLVNEYNKQNAAKQQQQGNITELEKQIKSRENIIGQLEGNISNLKITINGNQSLVREFNNKLQRSKEKIEALNRQEDEIRKVIAKTEGNIKKSTGSISSLQNELATANNALRELESQRDEKLELIRNLENENVDKSELISRLREDVNR
ncbi:putative leucine-rich repeat-containing protein DDB_G0290503, partial [Glossina fuscipes]|uniref:Leucine-rich repeat-containing protein DDB_G0290503 n=1 Tax=Glossina fuscipes TaxID=7396 RepID=A0A9C5ZLM3_9MUSC